MLGRERDVFDVGVHARARTASVMTGSRVMASKVSGPTKRRAVARHHRLHAVPALLQQARDLDRLVGADAAA